ncbi:MAG: hypothetical protein QM477_01345 [Planctomycetota bacterium]
MAYAQRGPDYGLNLMRTYLSILLASFLLLSPALAQKKVSKKELQRASVELAALYQADQEDQNLWGEVSEEELAKRSDERHTRVTALVAAGLMSTPKDYNYAAWLLQHGTGTDDFLMAHILASTASMEQMDEAYFMAAAALDRFLGYVDMPQRFGSQTFDEAGLDLGDTSALLSDAIVALYRGDASGLTGTPLKGNTRNKKSIKAAEKYLKSTAKKAKKASAAKDEKGLAKWQAMLQETQAWIAKGCLKSAQAYYDAGTILSFSKDRDALLLAHIMATTAGILEHKKARPLFTSTLDAFLLSIGRAPVFESVKKATEETPPLSPILQLHPRVRARLLGKMK